MTKWFKSALLMISATVLILSGCGAKSDSSLKEVMTNSYAKTADMKSYAFEASIGLEDLQLSPTVLADPAAAGIVDMLKSAKLDIAGVATQEPLKAEMKMTVEIPGDLALKFEIPMIMSEDKLYVKIPSLPMLPLPAELAGKYLLIDTKALAEQSGQDISKMMDTATAEKLGNAVMKEVLSKYDEKTYFTKLAAADANLPEDVKAKQVVKFAVTKDNFDSAATTLVKDVLPAVLDIVSQEEYRSYLEIEQADIDELKAELSADNGEFKTGLEELKKSLTVNEISVTTAIDKDQFPVFSRYLFDLDMNDNGEQMKLKLNITNKMFNINGEQKFSDIPTDTVPFEQLMGGLE